MLFRENYNVRKGEVVAISILDVTHYHLSCLLACAELGLKVFIIDAPATKESLPYTKLALHGPADYCVHHEFMGDELYDGLHGQMIREYSKELIDTRELIFKEPNDFEMPDKVSEDDIFMISSTSGSTKPSRKIEFTHKEVYEMSRRNIDIFKFKPETKVLHTKNMHHASAMICTLLPSIMVSEYHRSFTLPQNLDWISDLNILKQMISNEQYKINLKGGYHMTVPNQMILDFLLKSAFPSFKNKTIISMCGFTLPEEYIDYAKTFNLEFISHYGSIDTGIPLLVNYLDENTEYRSDCLGVPPDDFYDIQVSPTTNASVGCQLWSEDRTLDDILYIEDNLYFLKGRVENPNTVFDIPDDLDLDKFYQDTKLNMEQLRGHLKEIEKST
jgi:acyl-CoA synthetase (AMP-forming)/AMP-acid ligase II